MSPRELFFWADAIVAVMTAGLVILHKNPVVCALSLVMHLCSVAVFFLLLDASFLFVVQIILYAGAIMVLFLFVVMLLDPAGEGVAGRSGRLQLGLTLGSALVILAAVARVVQRLPGAHGDAAGSLPEQFGKADAVGRLLFTEYLFPFELASVLLLVAMMGALYMGKKEIN